MLVTFTKFYEIKGRTFIFDCIDEYGKTYHCKQLVSPKQALGILPISVGTKMEINGYGSPLDYHIIASYVLIGQRIISLDSTTQ